KRLRFDFAEETVHPRIARQHPMNTRSHSPICARPRNTQRAKWRRRAAAWLPLLFVASRMACGQEDEVVAAREQAQSYFESQEPRKAVATLAEAATKHPKDRTIAGMLFAGIRDHVWHLPQILPIQHRGAVKAVAFSPDGKFVATGSAEGDLFIST